MRLWRTNDEKNQLKKFKARTDFVNGIIGMVYRSRAALKEP